MTHRLPSDPGARPRPRGLAVLVVVIAAIAFIVLAPGVASPAPSGPRSVGFEPAELTGTDLGSVLATPHNNNEGNGHRTST
ncbi:hypothetical protein ACWGSV_03895, partial [Gordonia terrae]